MTLLKHSENPLSNLHVCPEGCVWENSAGLTVASSEHEYQYEKLVVYGHADKAERLMDKSHAVDVMHVANNVVNTEQESSIWLEKKTDVMEMAC